MRRIVILAILMCCSLVPAPVRAEGATLTVMTRNLYLGADVYVAAQQLPDVSAMAQFLWTQQQTTAFAARADAFAAEIAAARPDVIGLQEAAQWYCRPAYRSDTQTVIDYTQLLLGALAQRGLAYVIAQAPTDVPAVHTGFAIPTVPWVTMVTDEQFVPRFGENRAACGFAIQDVLLVKQSLAGAVTRSGASDFVYDYTLVPGLLDMNRGYAWMDLRLGNESARILSTHVEAFFYVGLQPYSIRQVSQLIRDLRSTRGATIVLGDFNNDPRDPVPTAVLNSGGLLPTSTACPVQRLAPTVATARTECNTYWLMRAAGFADAGPDALSGQYRTWGYRADLAGPALQRILESTLMTGTDGLTARLDYVFVRNGVTVHDARIIGNGWPTVGWPCPSATQRAASAFSARLLLGTPHPDAVCAPSDHAGVVASVSIHGSPPEQSVPPTQYAHTYTVILATVIIAGVLWWRRTQPVRRRMPRQWRVRIEWRRG